MKFRLALIAHIAGTLLLGIATGMPAQGLSDPDDVAKAIETAFMSGNSRSLSKLSAGQIELNLGQGPSVYSRDQARYVFTSFFDDHPTSEFSLGDVSVLQGHGTARGRLLSVDSNQPWNVFIRLDNSEGGWRLKEVRLSRETLTPKPSVSPTMPEFPPH